MSGLLYFNFSPLGWNFMNFGDFMSRLRREMKYMTRHLLKAAQLADALNGRRVIIFEGCFVSQEQKPNVRSINFEEAGSCSTVLGA